MFNFNALTCVLAKKSRQFHRIKWQSNALVSYYEILQLNSNCTSEEIREAFLFLSKKYHPDTNNPASNSVAFHKICEAYHTLSKPEMRSAYDLRMTVHRQPSAKINPKPNEVNNLWYSFNTRIRAKHRSAFVNDSTIQNNLFLRRTHDDKVKVAASNSTALILRPIDTETFSQPKFMSEHTAADVPASAHEHQSGVVTKGQLIFIPLPKDIPPLLYNEDVCTDAQDDMVANVKRKVMPAVVRKTSTNHSDNRSWSWNYMHKPPNWKARFLLVGFGFIYTMATYELVRTYYKNKTNQNRPARRSWARL